MALVVARELRAAARCLSARGLHVGATWASDLLLGMDDAGGHGAAADAGGGGGGSCFEFLDAPLSPAAEDVYVYAKALLDRREFLRVADLIERRAPLPCHNLLRFVRWYAKFMSGERRKEEELCEAPADDMRPDRPLVPGVINREVPELYSELSAAEREGSLDAFGLYIYGVVLKSMDRVEEARRCYCAAVAAYPLNWSAWMDLASLVADRNAFDASAYVGHWVRDLFAAHTLIEVHAAELAPPLLERAARLFPGSSFVLSLVAQAKYAMREYMEAESMFARIREGDRMRIDQLDLYSNILYVMEKRAELSRIAQDVVAIDKFRPESCCVLGNYYSLRGEHEKSVVCFKRALSLDRSYVSAWTLMGHEYVELKNHERAIQAYRQAVSVNPRDYRAWYGLGQVYELLKQGGYALHYYRKAAALRPYDARMWTALGACYKENSRPDDAIKCLIRAVDHDEADGAAALRLAQMYRDRNESALAAERFVQYVRIIDTAGGYAEALVFLARMAFTEGRRPQAEGLVSRVLALPHQQQQSEARTLLREMQDAGDSGAPPAAMSPASQAMMSPMSMDG